MQQELLPLFPLQVVLLPSAQIALHIFEDRYKEMIGEAMQHESEIGIVLASEKGIVNTGCTAIVDRVVQRYDDGRLDIIASGRRRFEILMLNEEKEYLRGTVHFFDDDNSDPPSADAVAKVEAGFAELKRLDTSDEQGPPANAPLSFQVGHAVPDLNFRQLLLVTRSEAERIQRLADYLPSALEKMRMVAHVRAVAPSNGHAKHTEF